MIQTLIMNLFKEDLLELPFAVLKTIHITAVHNPNDCIRLL